MRPVKAVRTWRTVRHLKPRQVAWRLACRGRFLWLRCVGPRQVAAAAQRLPLPDVEDPRLGRLAAHVLPWQRSVHGPHLAAMLRGRFVLLGRGVDFGTVEDVRWRRDLGEGNVALWRMTLGYFGYAPPLLAGGDPVALRAVASLVASLERQNGFGVAGVFRDVWNPYCASHRLVNLLLGLHLFERRAPAPAPVRARILSHIRFCAAFVRGNLEWDLGYNHLLKNLTALAVYAAGLPALPRRWRFLQLAVVETVARQVLADGGHAERSPMYHLLALFDLLLLVDAGVLPPPALETVAQRLRAMRTALATFTHPDGDIALFNDAWLGEAPPARTVASPTPDTAAATYALPHTGYAQLRSGPHAAVFDCGACGPDDNPAHAHADFLAVEATVAGRRFLVDAGVPTYGAGPLRDRCRSAAAHNGPRLVGNEPLEFWSSFRVGRRARAYPLGVAEGGSALCCAGWHDGYRSSGVRVARCLALYPARGLLILDLWAGAAGEAAVDFLIPSPWRPLAGSRYRHGAHAQGAPVEVVFTPLAGTAGPPAAAQHWPRYGAAASAARLRIAPETCGQGRWCACWLGWNGELPAADLEAWRANLAAALAKA